MRAILAKVTVAALLSCGRNFSVLFTPDSLNPQACPWPAPNQSIFIRLCVAHLPAVPEHRPGAQIDFADRGHVTGCSGKPACASCEVHGIGDYRKQSLRKWNGRGSRRIEEQRVSRFRYPVMLDMKHQSVPRPGLRSAQ